MTDAAASTADLDELDGLAGVAARALDALGELGVAVLTLVETVFPPIPSEVILPLAGFLGSTGAMSLPLVILAATAGSLAGALVLYALGAKLGHDRAVRLLARLPLVDADDFERSAAWFAKHGAVAVLVGRLVPGVRSLVSLPAGAERMRLPLFCVLTVVGSGIWNSLLVGLGAALGSQYELIDRYSGVLDWIVIAAVVGGVGWLVIRRIRRRRAATD